MRFNLIPLLVMAGAGLLQPAAALETSYFGAPDLSGYVLHRESDGDGDGDGVKETHIMHYMNPAGMTVFSMTTRGSLWAWSMDSHGATDGIDTNYVIRDSNCDGVFDERYALDEDFHVPDCLKHKTGILRPPGTPAVP